MRRQSLWLSRLTAAGLLASAIGCGSDSSDDGNGGHGGAGGIDPGDLKGAVSSGLLRAKDCPDLLTKIQDDAIAKVELAAELYKNAPPNLVQGGPSRGGVAVDGDVAVSDGVPPPTDANSGGAQVPGVGGGNGSSADGSGTGSSGGGTPSKGESGDPTGSSNTNTQVEGVDEADFVKVVDNGKAMFLLHGNRLLKLDTWPPEATALEDGSLKIEGSPSEMFVAGDKAVVFSSVFGYDTNVDGKAGVPYCDAYSCGGSNYTKVTVADVSGATPKTVRELYYEGYYVSSRRYDDVVRVIMQAQAQYYNLFTPSVQYQDPWGRKYSDEEIANQLDEWRDRTAAAIRNTKLEDWLPLVQEAKNGKLAAVEPECGSYYVPGAGLADYGLTHVLSIDTSAANAKVGGVTILGMTSTVYSNAAQLVLAQPDYRAYRMDYGFVDLQQTALHLFSIKGADTSYQASGFIPGQLAGNIPQFALDENAGVIRAATTGWERVNPKAQEYSEGWWETTTVNRVVTAKADGNEIKVADVLSPLGHKNETIRSSRFLGDRGYIVTARNTDPLIVVDLKDPENLKELGSVEIEGFSEYMHPLDDNHLVTLGQNGSQWGLQLQIFDVTNAMQPKRTAVLDLGNGTSSEASYQHKAFTYYAEKKLLAIPLYNYDYQGTFRSGLEVVRVDAAKGFTDLGMIDHSNLIQQQTCGVCEAYGNCYPTPCSSYAPEVRRGHFVSGDKSTYVYSFSYGGVLVHEISDLATALATVELPQPDWSSDSWYGAKTPGGTTGSDPGTGIGAEPSSPPAMGGSTDGGAGTVEPTPADAGVAMGG